MNILYNEDCFEILPKLSSIDLVLTDLPYGTTSCKWDSILPLDKLWKQFKRIAKPNTAFVFTACQPFTTTLINSNPKWFKYDWIWEKTKSTGYLNANIAPLREHEEILVFCSKQSLYNPQGLTPCKKPRGMNSNNGDCYGKSDNNYIQLFENYPKSILHIKYEINPVHPTQKPVALMKYLINTYSNPGDTVLDCCMGSGTTGVACVETGRDFIGIEKEKEYFEIAKKRIEAAEIDKPMDLEKFFK